eukprot:g2671.t1
MDFAACAVFLLATVQSVTGRCPVTCPGDFYVRPAVGLEASGDGSAASPFVSLHDARAAIDACAPAMCARGAVIYLHPGTHELRGRPLDFGAARAQYSEQWRSLPGRAAAVLSGGTRVSNWTQMAPGRWATSLAGYGLPNPRSLRLDDGLLRRLPQVTYPAADAPNATQRYVYVRAVTPLAPLAGATQNMTFRVDVDAAALPAGWRAWSNVMVVAFPRNSWESLRVVATPTAPAAPSLASFVLTCPDGTAGLYPGNRLVFVGEPSLLGAPGTSGSWAYDARARLLHLLWPTPRGGATVAAVTGTGTPPDAFVPALTRIATVEGRANVSLLGVGFADTHFLASGVQEGFNHNDSVPGIPHDAAVAISRSTGVVVQGCFFAALGGGGIVIGNSSSGVAVLDSSFQDVGQSAVLFVGDAATQATNATVAGNEIRGVGQLLASAGGVVLTSASGVRVSRNNISDSARWGIAIRSNPQAPSRNNTIELNRVHRTGLTTADFGAISVIDHTATRSGGGNRVVSNCVRDTLGMRDKAWRGAAYFGQLCAPWWGRALYLDDFTSNTAVEGNVFLGSSHVSVYMHGGSNNSMRNNVFGSAGTASESAFVLFNDINNAAMRGLILERNVMLGARPLPFLQARDPSRVQLTNGSAHRNLYWLAGGLHDAPLFMRQTWKRWRAGGHDAGSLTEAPLFVAANLSGSGDWRLTPQSPLHSLGFEALAMPIC